MATTTDLQRLFYINALGLTEEQGARLSISDLELMYAQAPSGGAGGGWSKILPAKEVRAWGHSYMAGVGPGIVDASTEGMAALIAQGVGLPLNNLSVGGSTLFGRSGQCDWGEVLQNETRGQNFFPTGGFFPLMWGLNDINHLPADYARQAPYRTSLRTVITRLRAAAVFENSHESVVLEGASPWAAVSLGVDDSIGRSGDDSRYSNQNGATITITTPVDFPGGTIALGFTAWTDGGATITGTVNGQTYSINTAASYSSTTQTPSVLRIPGVPSGQDSYTFTVSDVVGAIGCIFDYWSWEPPEYLCPIVAVIGQPYPLDYDGYGAGGAYGPPSDIKVDTLNQGQQDVVDEFGDRVIYVDTHGISKDPAYWNAGNVHPLAPGHAWIAERVVDEVKNVGVSFAPSYSTGTGTNDAPPQNDAPQWENWTPVLSGAGTSIGDGSFQTASYVRDGDTVSFYTRLVRGPTTVFGTWVELNLPVNPLNETTIVDLRVLIIDADGWPRQDVIPRVIGAGLIRFYTSTGAMNDTAPITWAAGDALDVSGTYRV